MSECLSCKKPEAAEGGGWEWGGRAEGGEEALFEGEHFDGGAARVCPAPIFASSFGPDCFGGSGRARVWALRQGRYRSMPYQNSETPGFLPSSVCTR